MISNLQYSISLRELDLENKDNKRFIEDSLEDFHFSYWAIPPDAPVDVVRMVGQTKHGHSFLQFSNKLAHLTINFDDNYKDNVSKCMEYASEKLLKLVDSLEKLKVNVSYGGVIAQYIYEDIEKPIERLRKKMVCIDEHSLNLYGLGTRITFIYKDRYFINFDLSSLLLPPNQKKALGVKIDVNDKYGVERNGMLSSASDIFKLLAIQKMINQQMIMRLLDEGKFDLHE